MNENLFEIPQAMRDVAEQNLTQAHAAYEQLADFEDKIVRVGIAAIPSPMAAQL